MIIYSFVVITFSCMISNSVLAQDIDFWLSIGANDGGILSLSLGGRYSYIGAEVGIIGIEDTNSSSNILDYPVPHNDYIDIGRQDTHSASGIDILGFFDLSKQVSLYLGPGLYWRTYKDVAMSNVTGWFYTQSEYTETESVFSGGIRFYPVGISGMLGIGYHSDRGINIQLGRRF